MKNETQNDISLQWVGHLSFQQPTWVWFPASNIVPIPQQEWMLSVDKGVTPEHHWIWSKNKNERKKERK